MIKKLTFDVDRQDWKTMKDQHDKINEIIDWINARHPAKTAMTRCQETKGSNQPILDMANEPSRPDICKCNKWTKGLCSVCTKDKKIIVCRGNYCINPNFGRDKLMFQDYNNSRIVTIYANGTWTASWRSGD